MVALGSTGDREADHQRRRHRRLRARSAGPHRPRVMGDGAARALPSIRPDNQMDAETDSRAGDAMTTRRQKSTSRGHSQSKTGLSIADEYITSLKDDPYSGARVRVGASEEYRIRIVSRGEQAFYQQNERALLVDIDPAHHAISRRSIRRWDDGILVGEREKDVIVQRLVAYLTAPRGTPDEGSS